MNEQEKPPKIDEDLKQEIHSAAETVRKNLLEKKQQEYREANGINDDKHLSMDNDFNNWLKNNSSTQEMWLQMAENVSEMTKIREKYVFMLLYDWNEYSEVCNELHQLLLIPRDNEKSIMQGVQESVEQTLEAGFPQADSSLSSRDSLRNEEIKRKQDLLSRILNTGAVDAGSVKNGNPDGIMGKHSALQFADIILDTTRGIHKVVRSLDSSAVTEKIESLLGNQNTVQIEDVLIQQKIKTWETSFDTEECMIVFSIQKKDQQEITVESGLFSSLENPSLHISFADEPDDMNPKAVLELNKILSEIEE